MNLNKMNKFEEINAIKCLKELIICQAQALFIQHAGHTYDVITFKKSTGRTVAQVIVYYKLNSKEQWKVLKKGEPDTVVSTALENLLQSLEKEIGIKADKMKEGSSFMAQSLA